MHIINPTDQRFLALYNNDDGVRYAACTIDDIAADYALQANHVPDERVAPDQVWAMSGAGVHEVSMSTHCEQPPGDYPRYVTLKATWLQGDTFLHAEAIYVVRES